MKTPLSKTEFESCMGVFSPFEKNPQVAVAVSGGADSLALTLLAHRWAKERGGRVFALTVDHGLRPESFSEAQRVGLLLKSHSISHYILPWTGLKPTTKIQEEARRARYQLLRDWCAQQGVLHLLVGHHLRDQNETVAMRLERKTGLEGLAGMSREKNMREMRVLRPLLSVPKSRLEGFLKEENISWVEDPSNQNLSFTRVQWRQKLERFGESSSVIPQLGKTRVALESWGNQFTSTHCHIFPEGFVTIGLSSLRALPDTFQETILNGLLRTVGPFPYAPRLQRVRSLVGFLKDQSFSGRTCHGCLLKVKDEILYVCREHRKIKDTRILQKRSFGQKILWDERFQITLPKEKSNDPYPFELRPLGRTGWRILKKRAPDLKGTYPLSEAIWSVPSLWKGGYLAWAALSNQNFFETAHSSFWKDKVLFTPSYPLTGFGFVF